MVTTMPRDERRRRECLPIICTNSHRSREIFLSIWSVRSAEQLTFIPQIAPGIRSLDNTVNSCFLNGRHSRLLCLPSLFFLPMSTSYVSTSIGITWLELYLDKKKFKVVLHRVSKLFRALPKKDCNFSWNVFTEIKMGDLMLDGLFLGSHTQDIWRDGRQILFVARTRTKNAIGLG